MTSDMVLDLIADSTFTTFDDVLRFAEWYESHEHRTAWDEHRYQQAKVILDAVAKEQFHARP